MTTPPDQQEIERAVLYHLLGSELTEQGARLWDAFHEVGDGLQTGEQDLDAETVRALRHRLEEAQYWVETSLAPLVEGSFANPHHGNTAPETRAIQLAIERDTPPASEDS